MKKEINPIIQAIDDNNIVGLEKLLPKSNWGNEMLDGDGNTLLHLAVMRNKPDTVKALLDSGISVNSVNHRGATPLLRAVCDGKGAIVDILLKAGADLEIQDQEGFTPLLASIIHENSETIPFRLVDAGANVNAASHRGDLCLHWAAFSQNTELAKVLILKGADHLARNDVGELFTESSGDPEFNLEMKKFLVELERDNLRGALDGQGRESDESVDEIGLAL